MSKVRPGAVWLLLPLHGQGDTGNGKTLSPPKTWEGRIPRQSFSNQNVHRNPLEILLQSRC